MIGVLYLCKRTIAYSAICLLTLYCLLMSQPSFLSIHILLLVFRLHINHLRSLGGECFKHTILFFPIEGLFMGVICSTLRVDWRVYFFYCDQIVVVCSHHIHHFIYDYIYKKGVIIFNFIWKIKIKTYDFLIIFSKQSVTYS